MCLLDGVNPVINYQVFLRYFSILLFRSEAVILLSHYEGGNRKRSKYLTNADQKSLETVYFRLSFVASRATNGNRKLCFQRSLSAFVNSINVFDWRVPGVASVCSVAADAPSVFGFRDLS